MLRISLEDPNVKDGLTNILAMNAIRNRVSEGIAQSCTLQEAKKYIFYY